MKILKNSCKKTALPSVFNGQKGKKAFFLFPSNRSELFLQSNKKILKTLQKTVTKLRLSWAERQK